MLWETSAHPALGNPKTRARRIPASPEQRAAAENHPGAPSPASWEPGTARGASGGEIRGFLLQKKSPEASSALCHAAAFPPGAAGRGAQGVWSDAPLIAGNDRMLAGKVPGKEVRVFFFFIPRLLPLRLLLGPARDGAYRRLLPFIVIGGGTGCFSFRVLFVCFSSDSGTRRTHHSRPAASPPV